MEIRASVQFRSSGFGQYDQIEPYQGSGDVVFTKDTVQIHGATGLAFEISREDWRAIAKMSL